MDATTVLGLVEHEALAARGALGTLTDERVDLALALAVDLLAERRTEILAANEADLAAAEGKLDAGALDRSGSTTAG